jgi:hypothetical protein
MYLHYTHIISSFPLPLSPKNSPVHNSNKSECSKPTPMMRPNPPLKSCLCDKNIKYINPLQGPSYIWLEYLCSVRRVMDRTNFGCLGSNKEQLQFNNYYIGTRAKGCYSAILLWQSVSITVDILPFISKNWPERWFEFFIYSDCTVYVSLNCRKI